jgi:hypothetical protein
VGREEFERKTNDTQQIALAIVGEQKTLRLGKLQKMQNL